MAPGQKKKTSNKTPNDQKTRNTKSNSPLPNQKVTEEISETKVNSFEGTQKYRKREIVSNASRYEETVPDAHVEIIKPENDFEVLSSYSAGAGSQHLFVDEKEWEESGDDMNLTLDLKHLSESLRCIPFYKRLKLSEDTFDPIQISKMVEVAKQSRLAFSALKTEPVSETIDSMFADYTENSMIQIEKSNQEDVDDTSLQPSVIPANIERSIDALAFSLSDKPKTDLKAKSLETITDDSNTSDGLEFLCSLNIGNITKAKKDESAKSKITNNNVDEWLNSILED